VPQRLQALAQSFCGRTPDDAWIARVAAGAREAVGAQDDSRVSALYRRELTQTLVAGALARALGRLQG